MSNFPVYTVGTQSFEQYGTDGFNPYGYNAKGYDRHGTRFKIIKTLFPSYSAHDDSYDESVNYTVDLRDDWDLPMECFRTLLFVGTTVYLMYDWNTPGQWSYLNRFSTSFKVLPGTLA